MSAGTKLTRALVASAAATGCAVRLVSACERPWASATFTGARHAIVLEAAASAAWNAWLAALPETEFALPGHVVADLAVERIAGEARVAALTLVEA